LPARSSGADLSARLGTLPAPRPAAKHWTLAFWPCVTQSAQAVRLPSPGGRFENSPPFQGWDDAIGTSSPEGTAESLSPNDMACQQTNNNRRVQPSLRDLGNGECEPGSELPGYSQFSLRERVACSSVLAREHCEGSVNIRAPASDGTRKSLAAGASFKIFSARMISDRQK
jgi:hypothetical protein